MANHTLPGPTCQVLNWFQDDIDPGTSATTRHEAPVSAGFGIPAGRIPVGERVDPGVAALESIDKYGEPYVPRKHERAFHLERRTLESFRALRAAAIEAGFDRELFTLTSDYRTQKKQDGLAEAARKKHGSRAAAGVFVAQGRSEHITGRAMDLHLDSRIKNSSENAKARAFDGLPQYKWLKANASRFGLNPYPYQSPSHPGEPWHWSYNTLPNPIGDFPLGYESWS